MIIDLSIPKINRRIPYDWIMLECRNLWINYNIRFFNSKDKQRGTIGLDHVGVQKPVDKLLQSMQKYIISIM